MIKKILVLVLLFPLIVNAACNYDKHAQYENLASNITYETNYSKGSNSYSVVVYSIFSNMYVSYNNKKYSPDSENKVTISGISPGTTAAIDVYANDGCPEIKMIYITADYYNRYYGSEECRGYEMLPQCSSQFTSSLITKEIVEQAKYNYDHPQEQYTPKEAPKEPSLYEKIKAFIESWGIKIILVVVTTFVASTLYNAKFRKIKHGI